MRLAKHTPVQIPRYSPRYFVFWFFSFPQNIERDRGLFPNISICILQRFCGWAGKKEKNISMILTHASPFLPGPLHVWFVFFSLFYFYFFFLGGVRLQSSHASR